jgi:DNA-binding GntR family transcriptional regulator
MKFDIDMPKSLTEIVAARLRQAIIDGEFALGQMISEETLAESFGVSRTPVRDALTLLQTTGLVEVRPKRGSFVFRPTEEDVIKVCEYRVLLEVHAARQSSERNRDLLLADLRRVYNEMQQAFAADDTVRYGHCDNHYLGDAYNLVSGKIAAMRTNLARQYSDARDTSMAEHAEVIRLIEAGDFEGLTTLLTAHIDRTIDSYQRAVRSQVL